MLAYYTELQQNLAETHARCSRAFGEGEETWRIYEAEDDKAAGNPFLLRVRASMEKDLRAAIAAGRARCRLGRLIFETADSRQASRLSDKQYE